MKKNIILFIIVGVILSLVGCNTNNNNTTEEPPNTDIVEETNELEETETEQNNETDEEQPLPNLEEQKTVDMMIEGMTEEKVVNVHHHQDLGFSTYVPDDMVVESNSEMFEVFTNFGGNKNENATLKINNQTEDQLTAALEGEGFTLETQETKAYEFSAKEYSLQKDGLMGRAAIFQHNGQDYTLYYYYPEEFADGFAPRSDIIINEIKWHDE